MSRATPHIYAIGIGSNRRHGRHGRPAGVVEAAIARLEADFGLFDASSIIINPAIGGAGRDFANAVAIIESDLTPPELLSLLKRMERDFGRRPGRRWGERVLDLDILAWDGGTWDSRSLTVPHQALADRPFAIGPLASIAPQWRPAGARTMRQIRMAGAKSRPKG